MCWNILGRPAAAWGDALAGLFRHQGLLFDEHVLMLEPHDGQVLLRYRPNGRVPRCIHECVVGGLALAARRALGQVPEEDKVHGRVWFEYQAHPELAISEIAYLAGYTDVSAFSKAVKPWTGKSPLAQRNR